MKALILSGGKGTRLRPITFTSAKQLVPVANKPILFWAIETIVAAGIRDIGIVVGDTAAEVKAAVGDGSRWEIDISYIQQEAPLGLAHAVKVSRDYLEDDHFVMYLGDNVIEGGIKSLVEGFEASDWNAQILLTQVKNPQAYGVAELKDGRVARLVEKPKVPPSDLALVGIYMFDSHIFQAVNSIQPSWRGELEITDAIQYLIEQGYWVHPHVHRGWWIDTGKMEDLLEANRLILEGLQPRSEGFVDEKSQLIGRVVLEKDARIVGSVIRGPAIIGERTMVVNSYIGPFTAIYHDAFISGSEIEHSIVLENSQIRDIEGRIESSLIGRSVEITRSPLKPKAYKLVLGDNSKVGVL